MNAQLNNKGLIGLRLAWRLAATMAALLMAMSLAACSEQSGGNPAKGPKPVAVRAVEVTQGPISEAVFVEGTARAVHREYLYFQRTGRVVWVAPGPGGRELREGDAVKKGQLLARLDARISNEDIKALQAAVVGARTQADYARAELRRRTVLLERKAIAPATWQSYKQAADSAEAQVKAAEARLRQSKVHGTMTALVSPMDGIIAYLNVKKGYYSMGPNMQAQSESELLNMIPMVVVDPSQYEITVGVPYFQAHDIKPGDQAIVGMGLIPPPGEEKSWAGPKPVTATVFSINPAVDPGSRHVQVRLRTSQACGELKDGLHVTGWIITKQEAKAILIPHDAILFQDGVAHAWVVQGDGVKLVRLELGLYDDKKSQVLGGLEPGQKVVTDGRYLLTPQSRITLSPAQTGAKD